MPATTITAALVAELVFVLERSDMSWHRGEPRRYLTRIAGMIEGITLPMVPAHARAVALRAKLTLTLLALIIDDEIDRQGTRRVLDESQLWMAELRLGRRRSAKGIAALLLDEVWALLPAGHDAAFVAFAFDFDEMLLGCSHEHTTNRWRQLASSIEYRKYGVAALGLKPLFALDLVFADPAPSERMHATLRVAFDRFALALKYASDIGSLERELAVEDNLNIVRILAAEAERVTLERGVPGDEQLRSQMVALASTVAEVRIEVEANLAAARDVLARVPELPMDGVLATVGALIEHYCSGRDVIA